MNTTTRKEDNPNSSESVEASLEDFINQANASFPTSDGWDLHTGDVELIDDDEESKLEQEEHLSAPIVVKPAARKADTAALLIKKADQSARSRKVTQAMLDDPNAKTTISEPPRRRNPFEVAVPLDDEPAPLDPPPTGPRRRAERTEVVESPLRATVPWTENPMIWIAGVFAAFVAGAVVVFVMVRTMMPSQPVVVQAPAPVVVHQPAAPVTQPVVTPLEPKAEPAAKAEQPVVNALPDASEIPPAPKTTHRSAKHAAKKEAVAVREAAPAVRPAATSKPAVTAKADSPKKAKAGAPGDDDDDDSAPAASPKKVAKKAESKAKSESKPKGGDWVDPFAQ